MTVQIISWGNTFWTKIPECKFCHHQYRNIEGYPNIFVGDKIGDRHFKRLVQSHMELNHKRVKVCYDYKY